MSSRFLLTCSVLGALGASSMTVYILPGGPAPLPRTTAAVPDPGSAGPAETLSAGPPVTGAQIAALAATPARKRAAALAAATTRTTAAETADPEEMTRREIREACEDGTLRGRVCRR